MDAAALVQLLNTPEGSRLPCNTDPTDSGEGASRWRFPAERQRL